MQRFTILLMALALGAFLAACSSGEEAADTAQNAVEQATDAAEGAADAVAAGHSVDMEIGCGGCIYKMDGVQSCVAAVKVAGKPMLLTGVDVDAHAHGLCSAPKQAKIAGKVEDGKFVASAVDVQ